MILRPRLSPVLPQDPLMFRLYLSSRLPLVFYPFPPFPVSFPRATFALRYASTSHSADLMCLALLLIHSLRVLHPPFRLIPYQYLTPSFPFRLSSISLVLVPSLHTSVSFAISFSPPSSFPHLHVFVPPHRTFSFLLVPFPSLHVNRPAAPSSHIEYPEALKVLEVHGVTRTDFISLCRFVPFNRRPSPHKMTRFMMHYWYHYQIFSLLFVRASDSLAMEDPIFGSLTSLRGEGHRQFTYTPARYSSRTCWYA